jgi:hypothetical protein
MTARPRTWFVDGLCLAAVVALSLVLYVGGLGFYSDDWAFLGILHRNPDQSLPGLVDALYSGDTVVRQRPVQVVYLSTLYKAVGLHPLAYHLVNSAALLAAVLLLYALLLELGQPRALAFAVAALYATLPNFSTDRFWIAAHQATLSVVFLLLGSWLALRGLRAAAMRAFVLRELAAGACFALSALAYEVGLPLLLLLGAMAVVQARRLRTPRRRLVAAAAAIAPMLLVALAFKAAVQAQTGGTDPYGEQLLAVATGAARVNLGVYGVGLPYVLWWIVRHALDPAALAIAVGAGALVTATVWRTYTPDVRPLGSRYVAAGASAFILGYAVFVVPTEVSFSSASLANRIGIAAALGVAAGFVGVLAWLLPRRAFAVALGVLCSAGCLVTNTLAGFWKGAYREQQRIVAGMTATLPHLRRGSAVIVDGVCLERGGAYVFTGKRDVTGVLRVRYDAPMLRGGALGDRPDLQREALELPTRKAALRFPYGADLIVYNAARRRAHRLPSRRAAVAYFESSGFSPRDDCPAGFAWRGPVSGRN